MWQYRVSLEFQHCQFHHLRESGDRACHLYHGQGFRHLRVCERDYAPCCENDHGCVSVPLLRESTFSRGRGQTRHHDRDRHRRDDLRLWCIVLTSRSLGICLF